jgi:hypothetical protein
VLRVAAVAFMRASSRARSLGEGLICSRARSNRSQHGPMPGSRPCISAMKSLRSTGEALGRMVSGSSRERNPAASTHATTPSALHRTTSSRVLLMPRIFRWRR